MDKPRIDFHSYVMKLVVTLRTRSVISRTHEIEYHYGLS